MQNKFKFRTYFTPKIVVILLAIFFSGFLAGIYYYSSRLGNVVLFSSIFIITFFLVALYHKKQLTIILSASAIALVLAFILIDEFYWEVVVDHYIEWEVLAVVLGMTILVEATSETGLFDWLIIRMLKISRGNPYPLFVLTFFITLMLSTVLANVTAMILIGSMIFTVCKGLDYDPTPFLLTAILATDLAGMATLVSSLPAIMVGSAAEIPFINFLFISIPFLIVVTPLCIYYMKKFYPPESIPLSSMPIDKEMILSLDEWGVVENRKSFYFAWVALGVTVIGFVISDQIGIPIGVIAILGGIAAIVLTQADETRLIHGMNWDVIMFFTGLFILVGTLEETGVLEDLAQGIDNLSGGDLFISALLILLIAGFFSGLLDNIPVTAALIHVVSDITKSHPDNPYYLWFVLLFAGSFGGGWTPFGSAAAILVMSMLSREESPLDFKHFIKVFLPISFLLLVLSGIYLSILAFFRII